MDKFITVFFATLLSVAMVVGFIYITDQPEALAHPVGQKVKADVEQDQLQTRFDEVRERGEAEDLNL